MRKFGFFLLCIFVLAFAGGAQAQTGFGLKGGMAIAKLTGDIPDEFESRTGFMLGAFAGVPIGESMTFQPEVAYVQKGASASELGVDMTIKLDYIDIPLLFKYTVAGEGAKPYFLVGPSIGFNTKAEIHAEFEGQEETEDISDNVKSTDFGLVFGLGVELQQFLIEARYSLGLSDLNDFPDDPDSFKNSVIAIQIGYAFPTSQ